MTDDWRTRAEALADGLRSEGWRPAVRAVPRHVFVPRFYEQAATGHRMIDSGDDVSRQTWLERVYSDTTLITVLLDAGAGGQVPVSSSTKPGLMVRMLEALDLRDGHRVLEIGTGTGYNAALLCHRLGADRVFSVDLRPELVDAARDRRAGLGHRPVLRATDGSGGLPEHAPYDRIVATCSVPRIPPAWIEQTAPGGLVLVDVEGQWSAGNLVLLRRAGDPTVEGTFLDWYGRFMPMRHDATDSGRSWPTVDRTQGHERSTSVDPAELDGAFRFLAQLRLPPGIRHTITLCDGAPSATCLTGRDGSWCSVDRTADRAGRHRVRHAGPRDLWAGVERAHDEWAAMGAPAWHRFGLTATPTAQHLWLDDPDTVVADL